MSLDLYKYLYNKQIYQIPSKQNLYSICISNFDMSNYNTRKDKYASIKKICQQDWIPDSLKSKAYDDLHFCNKMYMAFLKFYTHITFKKVKIFDYKADICGNSLETLPSSCKVNLVCNHTLYQFRISDLLHIINDSLINNHYLHLEPSDIKNPYTNEKFSIANLYNIYFSVKYSHYKMPQLFHYFFLCNFDKDDFCTQYNYEIREEITRQKFINLTQPEFVLKITNMLKCTKNIFKNLFISPKLPNDILVSAFKPFLKLFISISNTKNLAQGSKLKELFIKKAIAFNNENKLFGRHITKRVHDLQNMNFTQKNVRKVVTNYIPFEKLDTSKIPRYKIRKYTFIDFYDVDSSDISDSDSNLTEIISDEEESPDTQIVSNNSSPTHRIYNRDHIESSIDSQEEYSNYLLSIRNDHTNFLELLHSYTARSDEVAENNVEQEIIGTVDDIITNVVNS